MPIILSQSFQNIYYEDRNGRTGGSRFSLYALANTDATIRNALNNINASAVTGNSDFVATNPSLPGLNLYAFHITQGGEKTVFFCCFRVVPPGGFNINAIQQSAVCQTLAGVNRSPPNSHKFLLFGIGAHINGVVGNPRYQMHDYFDRNMTSAGTIIHNAANHTMQIHL